MPRFTALMIAALALTACPQSGVERCNDSPDDPACIPDAGTVGGLTYRTEQIPVGDDRWTDVQLGLCGSFERRVVWLMPGGAPADGFVVQQVEVEGSGFCPIDPEMPEHFEYLDVCTDPPDIESLPPACIEDGEPFIDRGRLRYWEAFPMEAGDVRYANEDLWFLPPQVVARGSALVSGAARYYTAEALGDEHPDHPDSPFSVQPIVAGASRLPSTDREPEFWRDDPRPTLDRMMRVTWRCCPSMITVIEEDTHDR